jgi:mediator of RNA polymerase II transcription subunit 16
VVTDKFSAAIASLTLAFCRGCGGEVNTDDILLILMRQLSPGQSFLTNGGSLFNDFIDAQTAFLNEVYRALSINCNFTTEQDKLMNHPYIPRALSIQAALGFKGKFKARNIASNVPWAIIQLRQAAMIYPSFFQYNKGVQGPEPHDPGDSAIQAPTAFTDFLPPQTSSAWSSETPNGLLTSLYTF